MHVFVDEFGDISIVENSSSSNDFDVEDVLFDDDAEQMIVLLMVKDLEDRRKDPLRGLTIGHLCILRNCTLGHEMLKRDYFAEVSTYPPPLICRRYQTRKELFVKIVKASEANCCFLLTGGMRPVFSVLGCTKDFGGHADDCIWHSRGLDR
jgi:hypothetical protein